eukprot:scaffold425_cov175-Amphora_coffeaeformis.AAC.60
MDFNNGSIRKLNAESLFVLLSLGGHRNAIQSSSFRSFAVILWLSHGSRVGESWIGISDLAFSSNAKEADTKQVRKQANKPEMEWIDDQLVSPVRVRELIRIYDRLVQSLVPTTHEFDPNVVAIYSNLWLTCLLLERSKDCLSYKQRESVTETKDRCLLILEVSELYADTPLDLLVPQSVATETENGLISWNFQNTISFDKAELVKEETILVEMADTPIPDQPSDSVQSQWYELQNRVRQAWGEEEYLKALENSTG